MTRLPSPHAGALELGGSSTGCLGKGFTSGFMDMIGLNLNSLKGPGGSPHWTHLSSRLHSEGRHCLGERHGLHILTVTGEHEIDGLRRSRSPPRVPGRSRTKLGGFYAMLTNL